MAEYQTKSSDFSTFEVTKAGNPIGKLSYKSWFRFDAVVLINDHIRYQVVPKGFWNSTIEVRDGDKLLLTFQMNWNGDITIETLFDGSAKGYRFSHKGVFNESFVLTDQDGTELLQMKPHLKWKLMNYEYEITTSDSFEAHSRKEILLMTSVHCANYYMSMASSYGA